MCCTSCQFQILFFANITVVVFFLLSCLAPFSNPQSWWVISFLGLAFPFLLVLVILFMIGWLILLRRYLATRLAVFSFLTPIIAAVFGWLILGDAISHSFIGGGVLVMLGIMVVNRR